MDNEKKEEKTNSLEGLSMDNVLGSYVNPDSSIEEENEEGNEGESELENESGEEKESKEPEAKKQSGVKKEEPKEKEADEGEQASDAESLVKKFVSQYGFEDINPDEFEETEEGFFQLNTVIAEKLAERELNNLFEQYPTAKEYFEYLLLGGDPQKYHSVKTPEVNYSDVSVEGNEDIQKTIVRKWLESQEYTKEEVESELDDYDKAGMLEKKAKIALAKLQAKQESDKASLIEKQREAANARAAEVKKYWDGVWNKLESSTTVKNLNIPISERKSLFDYMSKPVTKEGYSQEQIDEMEMKKDPEMRIALALIKMKKFNLSKYIDNAAKTKQAVSLAEKLGKGQPKVKAAANAKTQVLENPDIDQIQGINFSKP